MRILLEPGPYLGIPVAGPHDAPEVRGDDLLLVVLDPLLGTDGLDEAEDQVVSEGQSAEQLGEDQPQPGHPPQSVHCAHLPENIS